MMRWYAITTKAGPFTPARGLREQGFEVCVPKKFTGLRPASDARRLYPVASLRFEGYLFVRADAECGELGPVANTRGVGGLVPPYPSPPCHIDDEVIDGLRQAEDEELEAIRAQSKHKGPPYPLGSTVRIVRGSFRGVDHAGMHGQVAGYSAKTCLLTVFVGSWVWKVPAGDCEAVLVTQGGRP